MSVVPGLVTTKSPHLKPSEGFIVRIQEAARFVPVERLSLSPQCGFATSVIGNRISLEDQTRKQRWIVKTANRAWA